MSHYTKFDFQYTNSECLFSTCKRLNLKMQEKEIRKYSGMKWLIDEYPDYMTSLPSYSVFNCKNKGFNYFLEQVDNHFELSIEKYNMNVSNEIKAQRLALEFQTTYIEEVSKLFVKQMNEKGINAILEKTDEGFSIHFGTMYEKNILIKFNNGRVFEEVYGIKGQSCVSLTEALENMLSSSEVELNSEWTEEYYEEPEGDLALYSLIETGNSQ